MVIEFDGLSGGFSREGEYFMETPFKEDPYRELKTNTKLKACSEFNIPGIVVSYKESTLLNESEGMINILDAIIADAIEKSDHQKNYQTYVSMLADAYEFGGEEAVDCTMIEIEMMSEQANPIKRKIIELTKKFPHWGTKFYFPPPDAEGNLNETFNLDLDIKTINDSAYTKRLLSVNIGMRQVGAFSHDPMFLFNTIGHYCLAMKTKKVLGYDWQNWVKAKEEAEWVKM